MVRLMRRRGDGGKSSDAISDWRAPDIDGGRYHRCSRRRVCVKRGPFARRRRRRTEHR